MTSHSVINFTTATPPANPVDGDKYLIPIGATGVFAGQEGRVGAWFGKAWRALPLLGGDTVYDKNTGITWFYDENSGLLSPSAGNRLTDETFTGIYDGGAKVYEKWFNLGALPNTTTGNTAHGLTIDFAKPVVIEGRCFKASEALTLPYHDGTNVLAIKVDATNIVVTANFDASSYSGRCRLRYCKP